MSRSKNLKALLECRYALIYPNATANKYEAVALRDLLAFNDIIFWTGEVFSGDLGVARVQLDSGLPTDFLGNPMLWMIVSNRCAAAIRTAIQDDAQIVGLPVILKSGQLDTDRYSIVNPIKVYDAIRAKKRKGDVSLIDLVLDTSKIPEGTNIFRLKHQETIVVVSVAMIHLLIDSKFNGFATSPIECV